jgi:phosphatidate cytidylyltransferase
LLMRFVSGFIGIPLLIVLVFTKNGLPFILAVGVLSLIGLYEFYTSARKVGIKPQEWAGVVSVLLFILTATNKLNIESFVLKGISTLFIIATLTFELLRKDRAPIKNLGATYLSVVYVGWLFSYLVAIRGINGTFHINAIPQGIPTGAWLVLFVIFAAWAADTGAYLVGRKWGNHKLAPNLSPGKTWEGMWAGLASSVLISILMGAGLDIPLIHRFILGMAIGISSLVGDLVESSVKREVGIKDFGSILPGHGGILDRFDGLFFAAPMFYYYTTLILKF